MATPEDRSAGLDRSRACACCRRRRRSAGWRGLAGLPRASAAEHVLRRVLRRDGLAHRVHVPPCVRIRVGARHGLLSRRAVPRDRPLRPLAPPRARAAHAARAHARRLGSQRRRDRHVRAGARRHPARLGARVADRVRAVLHGRDADGRRLPAADALARQPRVPVRVRLRRAGSSRCWCSRSASCRCR